MRIFDVLKKNKRRIEHFGGHGENEANKLLKEATEYKKNGDINKAIEILKKANIEMDKSDSAYGVDKYLRLPLYLQEAGRNDEGWQELNGIGLKFTDIASQAIIFDKRRLFLQREGKHEEAMYHGVLTYLYKQWNLFMLVKELEKERHPQAKEKREELSKNRSKEGIEKALTPLLRKAKILKKIEQVAEIVEKQVEDMSTFNVANFKTELMNSIKK